MWKYSKTHALEGFRLRRRIAIGNTVARAMSALLERTHQPPSDRWREQDHRDSLNENTITAST